MSKLVLCTPFGALVLLLGNVLTLSGVRSVLPHGGEEGSGSLSSMLNESGVVSPVMEFFAQDRFTSTVVKSRLHACSPSYKGILDYPQILRTSTTPVAMLIGFVFWVVVLIWLLNSTAQEFFVPPLLYWSRLLHLGPEVSGATLVALGNSAVDGFAMAAAARADDLPLVLSEMLGSNMSVLCVTGGVLILSSHYKCSRDLDVAKSRDACWAVQGNPGRHYVEGLVAYAAALGYLSYVLQQGVVSTGKAACFPFAYVIYLVVLMWNHRLDDAELDFKREKGCHWPVGLAPLENASPIALVAWVFAWPTYAVRCVLIPSADLRWDRCRRTLGALAPIGLTIFWSLIRDGSYWAGTTTQAFAMSGFAGIAGLAIFFGSDDGPAVPRFYPILTCIAMVSSILLLSVVANELTATIETISLVFGAPRLWLASTVIAWGNSLDDLVIGVALIKCGQMRTAFTSLLAGPLFNATVGGGVSLALVAQRSGGSTILRSKGGGKQALFVAIAFSGVAWAILTIVLVCRWRSSPRLWSTALFSLYAVFLACEFYMEPFSPKERIDALREGGASPLG